MGNQERQTFTPNGAQSWSKANFAVDQANTSEDKSLVPGITLSLREGKDKIYNQFDNK